MANAEKTRTMWQRIGCIYGFTMREGVFVLYDAKGKSESTDAGGW